MDFISPVIDIVSHLLGPIARRIGYVVNLREKVNSLKEAMNELKCISNDVKTRVDVAERKLLKSKDEVQYWLKRVEATEEGVNEMEDSFQQMTKCFGNCRPNCWSGYKLGKRVAKMLTDVADLKTKGKDASFNEVAETPLPDPAVEQPSTSALGMDLMLEKVRGFLREDSVGVVGIYGMGGVGKTTLLKKINNETTRGFNVVIWVVVSKEANVAKIKKEIGERLGLIREENRNNDEIRAADIHKALNKMKFMLLLDDIWQRLDLELVGIPRPSNQSKVVFTTRFENVCYEMKAEKKVKVECLGWKEAWDLFRENVGEEALNSCRDIPGRAEAIAKECGGLPLMLITIGRAMASKKTPEEWKHAITALRSSPSDTSGTETEVFFRLKFSYDSLRNDIIKSCFLYCSLFPEDYDISKEMLIYYWIGEGFLDEWDDDLDSARNKGHDLIGTLKSACLLESGSDEKTEVKMHDVKRDLALWISSECGKKKNKFLVKAGVGLIEAPAIERWTEANRISLMENKIKEITETPNCPDLLTLMLQNNRSLIKITNDFFQFMPHLKVLDLSGTGIEEIPAGIGNLVELQYLNLSWTRIKKLPEEIGCLTKLKHLNLNRCNSLDGIPREAISRLSRLNVLKLLKGLSSEVTEESGWFYLTAMEGLKWLSHLEITIETVDDLKSYLDSHKLPKLTLALTIGIRKGLTTSTLLSSSFRAMRSIRRLRIDNCKEMEEMMIGWDVEIEDDHSVSSLEWLSLQRLDNLNIIRVGGCMQNLRHIDIYSCPKLKSVTWILQLQNLEEIWIQRCERVEEVIGTSDVRIPVREACLGRLKFLYLSYLPKLTSICNHALAFPSLETLEVIKCPKLKKLPVGLQSANNPLKKIIGKKEWWDGLEWEEDVIKSNLLPLFQERVW